MNDLKLLAYEGRSFIPSKLIRFFTWEDVTHIGILLPSGEVIEAWFTLKGFPGRVFLRDSYRDGHTLGTQVRVYNILGDYNSEVATTWFHSQVGKAYGLRDILKFITHTSTNKNNSWFCSELALEGIAQGDLNLQIGNFAKMSPRDVIMSPLLEQCALWEV